MLDKYFLFIIALFLNSLSYAQESMIPNVDNIYLEKLIAAAKLNYPRVKALRDRVDIAGLGVTKAKLDWFNVATASYVYSPNNTQIASAPSLNGYQVGISTSIGNILQRPNGVKTARK